MGRGGSVGSSISGVGVGRGVAGVDEADGVRVGVAAAVGVGDGVGVGLAGAVGVELARGEKGAEDGVGVGAAIVGISVLVSPTTMTNARTASSLSAHTEITTHRR